MTMPDVLINYAAVAVAALLHIALGFAWYGPLFGKEWMRLSGMTKEKMEAAKKKGMGGTYALALVSAFITAFVLAHIVAIADARGVIAGGESGFWVWLGFVAPVLLGSVLWDGKPKKLFYLNAGYYLLSLTIMGAILASWPA